MAIEQKQESQGKEERVVLDLFDRVVIEEDVSVYLRVAQDYVQQLKVSLILKILVGLLLTLMLHTSSCYNLGE